MAKSVAVVIVSWNGRDHLRPCLHALATQTYPNLKVVVVDNASTDGSPELVRNEFPQVQVIQSSKNLGFAAANNLAIRATNTPFVATLNNDTVVDPTWLQALVETAESGPGVGSVASRMVFAHAPEVMNSSGIAIDPVGIAWDRWGGYPASMATEPGEVFGACAGAALYRREMLDDVGLFSERFFAYLEDVDLSWRARLRRWRCLYAPDALVRHAHSGTLGEGSPRKRYLLARNKIWMIARCAPAEDLRERLPHIVVYDLGAAAFGVMRQHDFASVQGRLAGLAGLPAVLWERGEIQGRRTARIDEIRRWYAPLDAPWDVPRRYWHLSGRWPTMPAAASQSGHHALNTSNATPISRGSKRSPKQAFRSVGLALSGRLLPARADAASRDRQVYPPRVVVLRPDHLGDVLLSRPSFALLRESLGSGAVTVVAGPWGTPSLQGLGVRVATFPYPGFGRANAPNPFAPYRDLLALATRLRRERFDAALILRPDHWWGAFAAALAGIPVRVGHDYPETHPFLTRALAGRLPEHAAEGAMRAARAVLEELGIQPAAQSEVVTFTPSKQAEEEADTVLRHVLRRPSEFVVVHPGAGAPLKSWPGSRWASLTQALLEAGPVVLTGGPAERALLTDIQALVRPSVPVLTDLSWDTLAAVYRRAQLVVGQDSGPLHLASAVGAPTVRWYGPTDPRVFGPAGEPSANRALASTLPCAPCGNLIAPPCGYRQHPPCLAQISIDAVMQAASSLLPQPVAR